MLWPEHGKSIFAHVLPAAVAYDATDPMLDVRSFAAAAGRYLRQHPEEVTRALRQALALRVGIPVAAFHWLAQQVIDPDQVQDFEVSSQPPGVRLAASFKLMGSQVRAAARLFVEGVVIEPNSLRLDLRFEDVDLLPIDGARTTLTALLHAGALDLSRVGDLVQHLPGIPAVVVAAHGNRVSIDLLRNPDVANNPRVHALLAAVTPWLTVDGVESEAQHLDLHVRPLPRGVMAAVGALQSQVLVPSWRRVESLLPLRARERLQSGVRQVAAMLGER